MSTSRIEVSVVCLAYNHEQYIKKALDSILSQETTFEYEIIVHDDASTDNTAAILVEYANRYPNIIPVMQKENIYQLGRNAREVIVDYVHGKYVALCECDDWWIDKHKLQKQFDYMETHSECSLYTHAVEMRDESGENTIGYIAPSNCARSFSTDEVIRGGGGLFGTNSMFFPARYYILPELYQKWGVGDYPSCIYLSTQGDIHYDPVIMSGYRVGSVGSWTLRMRNKDYAIKNNQKIMRGLERFDKATSNQYSDAVIEIVDRFLLEQAMLEQDIHGLLFGRSGRAFWSLDVRQKIRVTAKCVMPRICAKLSSLKVIKLGR